MGAQMIYERYIWFDQQIKQGRFPNATTMAGQFGVSGKTAHRTIDWMRTMLDAPLEYDSTRKGYTYTDHSFSLPSFKVTQEELLAILVARNLLSGSAGGAISRAISRFGRKLFAMTGGVGLTEAFIDQVFSAAWHGYSPGQSETFQPLAEALLARRGVSFRYRSPHDDATTFRTVHPHHLQHYMGSWVLLAWCTLRNQWRRFLLARMDQVTVGKEAFQERPAAEWQHLLNDAFGIFQAEETFPVTLRFTPDRARWIREQHWHPKQEMAMEADGSLRLSLPMADLREIKLKVLQFGAGVEVLEPPALRNEIRQEIAAMRKRYEG